MTESAPKVMVRLASSVKELAAERPPPWKYSVLVGTEGAAPNTESAETWMVPPLM